MFLTFVNVLGMDILKIPYVYFDGTQTTGQAGRPKHGFYCKFNNRRAPSELQERLHALFPDIKHGEKVLFDDKNDNKLGLDENSSPDDLRKASIKILIRIMNSSDKDSATISAIKELLDRIDADEKRNGTGNNTHDIRTVMSLLTEDQLEQLERASG